MAPASRNVRILSLIAARAFAPRPKTSFAHHLRGRLSLPQCALRGTKRRRSLSTGWDERNNSDYKSKTANPVTQVIAILVCDAYERHQYQDAPPHQFGVLMAHRPAGSEYEIHDWPKYKPNEETGEKWDRATGYRVLPIQSGFPFWPVRLATVAFWPRRNRLGAYCRTTYAPRLQAARQAANNEGLPYSLRFS